MLETIFAASSCLKWSVIAVGLAPAPVELRIAIDIARSRILIWPIITISKYLLPVMLMMFHQLLKDPGRRGGGQEGGLFDNFPEELVTVC